MEHCSVLAALMYNILLMVYLKGGHPVKSSAESGQGCSTVKLVRDDLQVHQVSNTLKKHNRWIQLQEDELVAGSCGQHTQYFLGCKSALKLMNHLERQHADWIKVETFLFLWKMWKFTLREHIEAAPQFSLTWAGWNPRRTWALWQCQKVIRHNCFPHVPARAQNIMPFSGNLQHNGMTIHIPTQWPTTQVVISTFRDILYRQQTLSLKPRLSTTIVHLRAFKYDIGK